MEKSSCPVYSSLVSNFMVPSHPGIWQTHEKNCARVKRTSGWVRRYIATIESWMMLMIGAFDWAEMSWCCTAMMCRASACARTPWGT